MKTQLLVYRQQNCGFTETNDLTIREFSKADAFDAFDQQSLTCKIIIYGKAISLTIS